jgi:hypothetical protein
MRKTGKWSVGKLDIPIIAAIGDLAFWLLIVLTPTGVAYPAQALS